MKKMQMQKYAVSLVLAHMALPASAISQPTIGAAYQEGSDTFLDACVDIQPQFITNPVSTIGSTSEPVVDELVFGVDGNEGLIRDLFNGVDQHRQFENIYLRNKDYAEQFVTIFEYSPGQLLALGNPVMKAGAAAIMEPTQFYALCGNRYVSSVIVGGQIQVVSRIEYANAKEAQKFSMDFPPEQRVGYLTDEVVARLQQDNLNPAISIAIDLPAASKEHFFGYLKSHNVNPSLSLVCNTQTWSGCRQLLNAANDYLADIDTGFVSPFKNLSMESALAVAGERVVLSDYYTEGANSHILPAVDQISVNANSGPIESLIGKYEIRQNQRRRIATLQQIFVDRLDDEKRSQLAVLDGELQSEMSLIGAIGIACLEGATDCAEKSDALALHDVDEAALELPYIEAKESIADDVSDERHHGGGSLGLEVAIWLLSLICYKRARRKSAPSHLYL